MGEGDAPADPSYSWQESFTLMFESLLHTLSAEQGELVPVEEIRAYLSKAIGSFLFDDCEVPSLIWFTGSETDIYVQVPANGDGTAEIAMVFPSLSHALWGDALLETLLKEPSAVVWEGYGGSLVLFARQKTKRLWYTLFLSLVVLVDGTDGDVQVTGVKERREWAREELKRCVLALKDAPCY